MQIGHINGLFDSGAEYRTQDRPIGNKHDVNNSTHVLPSPTLDTKLYEGEGVVVGLVSVFGIGSETCYDPGSVGAGEAGCEPNAAHYLGIGGVIVGAGMIIGSFL